MIGRLVAILIVAAVLRFVGIDVPALWVDEANTWRIARAPLDTLPSLLANDSSPPLYYALLHVWMGIFGDAVVALRSLSAVLGVALVASVFALGRALHSPRTGLFSAWIVATSPAQIFYSQQVRMYSLLPLLSVLALLSLLRLLKRRDRGAVLLCAVTTALALYTHNFALYLLPAALGVAVLSKHVRGGAVRVALMCGLALALWAPWWPVFHVQLTAPDTYTWFEPRFRSWDLLTPLRATLLSFSPLGGYIEYAGLRQLPGQTVAAVGSMLLAVWGALVLRHRRDGVVAGWVPPVCLLIVPPTLAIGMSQFLAPHYVPGRIDQMVFPAFAILVGAAIAALPGRLLRTGVAAIFLALGILASTHYHGSDAEIGLDGDQSSLARAIREQAAGPTVILCTSLYRAPLEYSLRHATDLTFQSYPRSTAEHQGGQDDASLRADPVALRREAVAVLGVLRAFQDEMGPGATLLLVLADSPVNDVLAEELASWKHAQNESVIGRFRQRGTGTVATLISYHLAP